MWAPFVLAGLVPLLPFFMQMSSSMAFNLSIASLESRCFVSAVGEHFSQNAQSGEAVWKKSNT
jgi:hypothetical protein